MPRGEIVAVRVEDLELGQRIRVPGLRGLHAVVALESVAGGMTVHTEGGAVSYPYNDLIDAEDAGEVWL